jgi:uncharacterized RDD family membrane protein YckC
MKCPKCNYLGFDTGDRCRHCGYNFSLISNDAAADAAELTLHDAGAVETGIELPLNAGLGRLGADAAGKRVDEFDLALRHDSGSDTPADIARVSRPQSTPAVDIPSPQEPAAERAPGRAASLRSVGTVRTQDRPLPLFAPSPDDEDDTPLVKLPAAPRPPLSVRRTPDAPRMRVVPKAAPAVPLAEPALSFTDEPAEPESIPGVSRITRSNTAAPDRGSRVAAPQTGSGVRRGMAALLDHAILLTIDVIVAYFTLRMAGLDVDDWALLPRAPLVVFLLLIKLAYFGAFTAMGGQTIGKMAVHIRVVSEEYRDLGATQSMRRTFAGLLSALTLGIGFLPALAGDHRALHDRIARTRVVGAGPV